MGKHLIAVLSCWFVAAQAWAETPVYSFSVLNQRSPALTAQFWNPILAYVSQKSGVALRLKMGKTAPETTALTVRGEAQFAYTNHLFTPERVKLGWRVIARPNTDGIRGQLVVAESSPITRIEDLAGQTVAFPSPEAFAGYRVPMDAILRAGVQVNPVFAGNQEGAMGQLKIGKVAAAGVNEDVMAAFARREGFKYRVIWSSDTFKDLPITVAPTVPESHARAVQAAFINMSNDPEGRRILQEGAALLKLDPDFAFVRADDAEYENQKVFHRTTLVKG